MLPGIKGFQVPGEKQNTRKKTRNAANDIHFQMTLLEQMVLPKQVPHIIIR